jgi:hypothetical protein
LRQGKHCVYPREAWLTALTVIRVAACSRSGWRSSEPARRLPAGEALEFRLLKAKLERLGFFDRIVRGGAAVVESPYEAKEIATALTERAARSFGPANWREVSMETARFLLLHVMSRNFAPDELAAAPGLLDDFLSFGEPRSALASALPDELPIDPSGRPRPGPLNYTVGLVLVGEIRAWGLWMEHRSG